MTAASKLQMCDLEREVVADQGNLVLFDGLVDDGEGVGAGGALEVFELVDGDGNAGRRAEHGGVPIAAPVRGRGRWGKAEKQGNGGEGDAVHCV